MSSSNVQNLLQRMTLEEKIAQIRAVSIVDLLDDGTFSSELARKHLASGIGQVSRVAGFGGLGAAETAALGESIQAFLRDETPHAIPAILHEEVPLRFSDAWCNLVSAIHLTGEQLAAPS